MTTLGLDDKFVDFNPKIWQGYQSRAWLVGRTSVSDLAYYPAEWCWKKKGSVKACPLFAYTTKLGYIIGLSRVIPHLSIFRQLWNHGFKATQTWQILRRIWHSWVPRKIASMNWLTTANGLLVGEWRHKAKYEGYCRLCQSNSIETTEHALRSCPNSRGMDPIRRT